MTKRFKLRLSKLGNGMITDNQKREDLYFDKEFLDATLPDATEWLNVLNDENEQLKQTIETQNFNYDNAKSIIHDSENQIRNLKDKNEQLKKLLECSREEANDYCEELMEKDEFIRLYKSQRDDTIKENEQLKQENKELKKHIQELSDYIEELGGWEE